MLSTLMTVASATPTGVLTDDMIQVISSGFTSLQGTVNQVLVIAVPASVALIALTGGVKYALKKVKGVIASAA